MSTQVISDIPIHIHHEQKQFRLLELPSDISDLLFSNNPLKLQFKSGPGGHTVLCTAEKTFQIRQVSTSNSVYILAPTDPKDVSATAIPSSGLQAIAKCDSTLEVITLIPDTISALHQLRDIVPLYSMNDLLEHDSHSGPSVYKSNVFADVPLSDAECEKIWTEECVFQPSPAKGYFRPDKKVLVWGLKLLMSAILADGLDIAKGADVKSLNRLLDSLEQEDLLRPLAEAILKKLGGHEEDGKYIIDEHLTLTATGSILLEDVQEMEKSEFEYEWSNLLFKEWRSDVNMKLLEGLYTIDAKGVVRFARAAVSQGQSEAVKSKTDDKNSRDWHKRFKRNA